MTLLDPSEEVVLTSIAFGADGTLEISYIEKRNQTDSVGLMNTLLITSVETIGATNLYNDLLDAGVDLVDKALLSIRNPPQTLEDPRARRRKRVEPEEPDE